MAAKRRKSAKIKTEGILSVIQLVFAWCLGSLGDKETPDHLYAATTAEWPRNSAWFRRALIQVQFVWFCLAVSPRKTNRTRQNESR